ncbi:hypothetical protein KFE25_013566 [Diacronema lutheri]|uniref:TIR domain-containing protein n=1 Tax=Diacronema lutheri TaxID=2081491 RepID=A0A8J5XIY4_DIALT|nr:hypothetical protein KFE25_013566 [Diacronema lutheri]
MALPHTRALVIPNARPDALSRDQSAYVEVRADDGRVVPHLLLLAPEHAPEQRHVVTLLRETYHKTAFLTQAHVNQPGAGIQIDPRLMDARSSASSPAVSPKRPRKWPTLGSVSVSLEWVAPAADTSASAHHTDVRESGSPLPCASDGVDIAYSSQLTRSGDAAASAPDGDEPERRDVGLVSQAVLAARIDSALAAARAVDARASARVFAVLAIVVLLSFGGAFWAFALRAPFLRDSLPLTLPTLDLALVIMALWLRDDHTHTRAIRAALAAAVTAIGITISCTFRLALASVGAHTVPGFSFRVGVADIARDAARAVAAWLAVLVLGAALVTLVVAALRSASPARRVARLWSSIRLSTSASAALLFTHELLCAEQRCDEVRPRAERALLLCSASVLLAIACPMYAPHARIRMRALLLWLVRGEGAETDTPLIALLGLREAQRDGRAKARSATEVMEAAGLAFQVVDMLDLAEALRAGDAEAGSAGPLASASGWELDPPVRNAHCHVASSGACAWLSRSAERACARACAWLMARAPTHSRRRVAPEMARLSTPASGGGTPPVGSGSAQVGSRVQSSARLPAHAQVLVDSVRESAGLAVLHELSPTLGGGRKPSRRNRAERRSSWEAVTVTPRTVPTHRRAAREQAVDLRQLRAARNARVRNTAEAEDRVDFFVVHSHLDSAELKRAALADWCARREDCGETVWLDVLSDDAGIAPDERLAHMPFHLARARKLLVLCGLDFARSFEAVAQLFIWAVLGGSLGDVELLLLGGPESAAGVYASFDAFHVMWAQPARCSRSQERLVRAVELASVAGFNEVVRAYLQCVPQQAQPQPQ